MPVVRADGLTIGDGSPGALTRKVHQAFGALVRERVGLVPDG